MKCSRCKKLIEGSEIKFVREGDYMGKPLCRRCKAEVEDDSREKYRMGRAKECSKRNLYGKDTSSIENSVY